MTDIMLDVETMGLNPQTAGLIQLSAIKFNMDTRGIGPVFDRCPAPQPFRGWDDSTREFWLGKNRPVYLEIMSRQEPAVPVYQAFDRFCSEGAPDGGYRIWSKPSKFDWPFVESNMIQAGLAMPTPHWQSRDMNSFISGLMGKADKPDIEQYVPFTGDKHNGLHDCAYQIEVLFYALDRFVHAEIVND